MPAFFVVGGAVEHNAIQYFCLPSHLATSKRHENAAFFFLHWSNWTGTGWNICMTLCVIQKLNKWTKHWLSPLLNHLFWKNDLKEKWGGCYCSLYVDSEHWNTHLRTLHAVLMYSFIQIFRYSNIHLNTYLKQCSFNSFIIVNVFVLNMSVYLIYNNKY